MYLRTGLPDSKQISGQVWSPIWQRGLQDIIPYSYDVFNCKFFIVENAVTLNTPWIMLQESLGLLCNKNNKKGSKILWISKCEWTTFWSSADRVVIRSVLENKVCVCVCVCVCGEGPRSRSYGRKIKMISSFIFPSNGGPVEWNWHGKTELLGEKPVPVPLCPPQIPHAPTRDRTGVSAVGGRLLTAWAMARPLENKVRSASSYLRSQKITNFYNHDECQCLQENCVFNLGSINLYLILKAFVIFTHAYNRLEGRGHWTVWFIGGMIGMEYYTCNVGFEVCFCMFALTEGK
jgi:hypothetical protein